MSLYNKNVKHEIEIIKTEIPKREGEFLKTNSEDKNRPGNSKQQTNGVPLRSRPRHIAATTDGRPEYRSIKLALRQAQ